MRRILKGSYLRKDRITLSVHPDGITMLELSARRKRVSVSVLVEMYADVVFRETFGADAALDQVVEMMKRKQ